MLLKSLMYNKWLKDINLFKTSIKYETIKMIQSKFIN